MGVPAEDLILRPFQEVADRGNDAVANAEACDDAEVSGPLVKAGKSVAKEGERALKRLQSLWDTQVEKHGDAFREAMLENGDIDAKRKVLDDLLYDFEDYIEPDTFDADKFTELQAATKAFALATIDATKRVKIEESAPLASPQSLFPPLPPLPALPQVRPGRPFSGGERPMAQKRHTDLTSPVSPATPAGDSPTSPSLTLRPNFGPSSPKTQSPVMPGLPRRQSNGPSRTTSVRTRRATPVHVPAEPTLPTERRPSSPELLGLEASRTRMSPVSAVPRTTEWVHIHANSSKERQAPKGHLSQEIITEVDRVPEMTPITKFATSHIVNDSSDRSTIASTAASASSTDSRSSYLSSGTSIYSSQSDQRETAMASQVVVKRPLIPPRIRSQSKDTFKIPTSGAPDKPPQIPQQSFEQGLMLTAEISKTSHTADTPPLREPQCSIGVKSTFQVMGGFCRGAEVFRRAGHTRGIKQSIGFVENRQDMTGRCVGCSYAHAYSEVKIDIDKRSQANLHKYGARYRLRLLYKSHIDNTVTSQRRTDPHYACLFCIQAGSTIHEGDATVFQSPDALVLHLARHPQPLPPVEGVRVLYGDVPRDDPHAEDFDIHFTAPPIVTEMGDAVERAAVATAVKDHYQNYGAKKMAGPPSYNGDVLQFLTGARIIGVTFPERWEGKWCLGWHEGVSGAFPAKTIELEPPQQREIPVSDGNGGSGMSVRTKWKWQPPLDAGNPSAPAGMWLNFDKGDMISDVRSLYGDHWCWSGRIKGRWGVFPQSHILLSTLGPDMGDTGMGNASSGVSVLTKSKAKSKGFFMRKRSTSVASSDYSGGSSGRMSVAM